MTVADVADRYDTSPRTVRTWIGDGLLRAVNVSKKIESKKPRFWISEEALTDFEVLRMTLPAPSRRRRRRLRDAEVEKFY